MELEQYGDVYSPDEYRAPSHAVALADLQAITAQAERTPQRGRRSEAARMFPARQENLHAVELGVLAEAQLAPDAMSAQGRPVQNSLPLKSDRPPAVWVFDTTDLRWGGQRPGEGSLVVWDGRPLPFEQDEGVRPHLAPWNPWTKFPNIARGKPLPTQAPTLGG